jgi:hypothetical protein
MAEELITSDCFKDKTLDGQLYDILTAIDQIGTLPSGNVIAEVQNGQLVNVEEIDAGQF